MGIYQDYMQDTCCTEDWNFFVQVASIVPEAKECGAKLVFGAQSAAVSGEKQTAELLSLAWLGAFGWSKNQGSWTKATRITMNWQICDWKAEVQNQRRDQGDLEQVLSFRQTSLVQTQKGAVWNRTSTTSCWNAGRLCQQVVPTDADNSNDSRDIHVILLVEEIPNNHLGCMKPSK